MKKIKCEECGKITNLLIYHNDMFLCQKCFSEHANDEMLIGS